MVQDYYTTTEAAKLLSVSADTVLKWVRADKIESYKTPGGHARIPKEAIERLLLDMKNVDEEISNETETREQFFRFCWDLFSKDGRIKEECLNCKAYLTRASRCFEMLKIPKQLEMLNLKCNLECSECEYYKLTQRKELYILLISASKDLVETLEKEVKDSHLVLKCVSTEYECAASIDKFRPDFIIVDSALGSTVTRELIQSLANDKRIPITRTVVCSRTAKVDDYCDSEIFGWIKKPFTLRQVEEFIENAAKI